MARAKASGTVDGDGRATAAQRARKAVRGAGVQRPVERHEGI
jgi:hypothetical protein|eukprot:COSAG01_NODE_9514_length_2423_cov_1.857573_1_plen_42_part_00